MKIKIGWLILIMLVAGMAIAFAASSHVGIFICIEEDPRLASIIRKDASIVSDPVYIYEGDKLPKNIGLEFRLEDYGSAVDVGDAYQFHENKPGFFHNLITMAERFFSHEKTITESVSGVARNKPGKIGLQYPQPGFLATVISGMPVTFSWGQDTSLYIVFRDHMGREIARKDVSGRKEMVLQPDEIGLKPGETYTWQVSNISRSFRVTILREEIAKKILADLDQYDREEGNLADKKLKKVAYLQMVSDLFSESIDLYWLSYQQLMNIEAVDADIEILIERFKLRVARHLNEQS